MYAMYAMYGMYACVCVCMYAMYICLYVCVCMSVRMSGCMYVAEGYIALAQRLMAEAARLKQEARLIAEAFSGEKREGGEKGDRKGQWNGVHAVCVYIYMRHMTSLLLLV